MTTIMVSIFEFWKARAIQLWQWHYLNHLAMWRQTERLHDMRNVNLSQNWDGFVIMAISGLNNALRYVALPRGRTPQWQIVLYLLFEELGIDFPSRRLPPTAPDMENAFLNIFEENYRNPQRGMIGVASVRPYRDIYMTTVWHITNQPQNFLQPTYWESIWNLNYQIDIGALFNVAQIHRRGFSKLVHLLSNVFQSIPIDVAERLMIKFEFVQNNEIRFGTGYMNLNTDIFTNFFNFLRVHLFFPASNVNFRFIWSSCIVHLSTYNNIPLAGEQDSFMKYFRNMFFSPYDFIRNKFNIVKIRLKKMQKFPIVPSTLRNCIFTSIILTIKWEKKGNQFYTPYYKQNKKIKRVIISSASQLKARLALKYKQEYNTFDLTEDFFLAYYRLFKDDLESLFINLSLLKRRNIIVWDETLKKKTEYFPYNLKSKKFQLSCLPFTKFKNQIPIVMWIVAGHAISLVDGKFDLDTVIKKEYFKNVKIKSLLDFNYKKYVKTQQKEKVLIFFDYETLALEKPLPYALGWSISNSPEIYYSFGKLCTIKFLAFLQKLKNQTYIMFAHNGGRFDFLFFLQIIMGKKDYSIIKIIEQHGRISYIRFCYKCLNKNITFICLDSYCFLPFSLKTIGESFKLPIQKGEIDHCKMTSFKIVKKFQNQIVSYLIKDIIVLKDALLMFNKVLFKHFNVLFYNFISLSSISKFIFKTQYYKPIKYPIFRLKIEFDRLFRTKAYFGGRTECFFQGHIKGPLWYYDFTSLYPFCLLKSLPYGVPKIIYGLGNCDRKRKNNISDESLFKKIVLSPNNYGWYVVKIKSNSYNWKPLHAQKINKRLFFSHFKDWTEIFIFSEELKLSFKLKLDYSYQFVRFYKFENKCYYKKFIKYLYVLKKKGTLDNNYVLRTVGKLLLNSAYGFWGLKYYDVKQIDVTKSKIDKAFHYLNNMSLYDVNRIHDYTLYRYKGMIDCDAVNIPIAAATTAYARMMLYQLFFDIEQKKGEIYYCDTDSIITNYCIEKDQELNEKYMKNKGLILGELKNELEYNQPFAHVVILGLKMYILQEYNGKIHSKLKGMKKGDFKKKFYDAEESKIYCFSTFPKNFDELTKNKNWKLITGKNGTKIVFNDYILMSQNWQLILFTNRFYASAKSLFKDDFGQIEQKFAQKICFHQLYSKGNVENSGKISPYVL